MDDGIKYSARYSGLIYNKRQLRLSWLYNVNLRWKLTIGQKNPLRSITGGRGELLNKLLGVQLKTDGTLVLFVISLVDFSVGIAGVPELVAVLAEYGLIVDVFEETAVV